MWRGRVNDGDSIAQCLRVFFFFFNGMPRGKLSFFALAVHVSQVGFIADNIYDSWLKITNTRFLLCWQTAGWIFRGKLSSGDMTNINQLWWPTIYRAALLVSPTLILAPAFWNLRGYDFLHPAGSPARHLQQAYPLWSVQLPHRTAVKLLNPTVGSGQLGCKFAQKKSQPKEGKLWKFTTLVDHSIYSLMPHTCTWPCRQECRRLPVPWTLPALSHGLLRLPPSFSFLEVVLLAVSNGCLWILIGFLNLLPLYAIVGVRMKLNLSMFKYV